MSQTVQNCYGEQRDYYKKDKNVPITLISELTNLHKASTASPNISLHV